MCRQQRLDNKDVNGWLLYGSRIITMWLVISSAIVRLDAARQQAIVLPAVIGYRLTLDLTNHFSNREQRTSL